MTDIIPITFTQTNLGQRHCQLNTFVKLAYANKIPFESIEHLMEKSPVDRLFKIDYASQLRNVDYILKNIKDEDMLYVSRALKCKWLLETEYQEIICPSYLEDVLYPEMVTTAVSKMGNWLYLHLRDPERCEKFYRFYNKKNFAHAIKFLSHCSNSFILDETPKIIEKLTPHYFKILCESCPSVAKIYFDSVPVNDRVKSNFLDNHSAYYNSLKVVLKPKPDIFFDIIEKYFKIQFSPSFTKYILKNHKDQFEKKVELYCSSLLNMEFMAGCLSPDECKEVVLKLAQAKYLEYWFSYKTIEPLMKRLRPDERPAFKKRIFVDKDIGELVQEWPYNIPSLPTREYFDVHIFVDPKPSLFECYNLREDDYAVDVKCGFSMQACFLSRCERVKTYLDKLFDEFRFVGFTKTLFELSRRIKAESSLKNREHILLVLVSKCGGHLENLTSLLKLLAQHSNEPVHLRAAVVRSLVKRAAVWRLPQDNWEALMQFARGLGLDGKTPEADCCEGLHAVVLRSLLGTGFCDQPVRDAFFRKFSNFKEYPINSDEKNIIAIQLPAFILTAAEAESKHDNKAHYLSLLLDTLQTYKINVEKSTLIPAVISLAKCDMSAVESLLQRLFDQKISRRILFHENFQLIQNDASYVNALRHNISVIDVSKFVDLVEKGEQRMEQFLRKIAIYFTEKFGLEDRCLSDIKRRILEKLDIKSTIARSLCLLQGADLTFIRAINSDTKHGAQISAAMRANMHVGRPKLDITGTELNVIGAKGCANKVLVCAKSKVDEFINDLLKWKRTVKIAIVLAERIGKEADAFATAVNLRPTNTLKATIKYFRRRGDSFDPRVWEVIKDTLQNVDYTLTQRKRLRDLVCNVDYIPMTIRAEYCTILYPVFKNRFPKETHKILYHLEDCVQDVKDGYIEEMILEFLNQLNAADKREIDDATSLYFRILVKYLFFSKTESIQGARLTVIGDPFLNCLEKLLKTQEGDFMNIFEGIIRSLQLNKVFFDVSYVSPLPVVEKMLSWMHIYLPIEINFNIYVYIHLIMLYFRAVRHSVTEKPDIFTDEKRKMNEGVDVVGNLFGIYIAREVKQQMSNYFESVIEIYQKGLIEYFDKYFNYGESKTRFIVAVIKGILDGAVGSESKIAVYLLSNTLYIVQGETKLEIIEKMKSIKNVELHFVMFDELYE